MGGSSSTRRMRTARSAMGWTSSVGPPGRAHTLIGRMHDLRLYRIALIPAFLALFVAAFALENRPRPATTPLTAEAFDGARAFGSAEAPPRDSLRELAAAFPDRRPGSEGDARLADR